MSPGVEKRVEYLPSDLEARLPPLLSFYRRGMIGRHVVIIDVRNRRILDVVYAGATPR